MYYVLNENKGADQLCGYSAPLFSHMQKACFLMTRLKFKHHLVSKRFKINHHQNISVMKKIYEKIHYLHWS